MSIVKVDSETVAEIKNALCVIQLNAEAVGNRLQVAKLMTGIVKQVKRIDKLLPKVAFEGGQK